MTKGELIHALTPFMDEIEIFVLDCNNMPLSIKHVCYVLEVNQTATIELVPMGSHQTNPEAQFIDEPETGKDEK